MLAAMGETRVAAIPGGASGIGRAIALDLAAAGWRVAICYRTSQAAADATADAAAAAGGEAWATRCDVSDPAAAADWIEAVDRRWGRLDALIHCAGPYARARLLEQSPAEWRAMFAGNLDSLFYTARAAAPRLIATGRGRIVTFSMASADRMAANTGLTAHFIAKSGVQQLTRALARELAPHGVTANSISPGFIDTENAPADELERMTARIPAGHVGTTADVVAAVRFLLSDEAGYVTGADIVVSGGWGI
jgi:3-oxoacyl-[acyl-carrier protein] reductase